MSTTNDPEGEYKRKPMLDSDELYDEYLGDCPGNVGGTVIEKIINFYEGKINDGTLMVTRENIIAGMKDIEPRREPLILDSAVKQMRESYEFLFSLHEELNSEAWLIGALDMRKKYERLIEEGKLVVAR